MSDILEIKNLAKSFGSKEVLKDVSFKIPEGKIFGFVGVNGAGKTTTMKIILGLLEADGGEVRVCGEKVSGAGEKTNRYIGYLPDVPEFYSYMNAREYLEFVGDITGYDGDRRGRTEELLELVGLKNDAKRRIKGYSRGMKQRLGIAQALFAKPKLLICDEPTSALDPVGRKEILDLLSAAKAETTVLFSTHILSDVERVADEIAMLHDGVIKFAGNTKDIIEANVGQAYVLELEEEGQAAALKEEFPKLEALGITPDKKAGSESVSDNHSRSIIIPNRELAAEVTRYLGSNNIVPLKFEKQEADLESIFMKNMQV